MTRALIVTTVPGTLRSFLLPFALHFRSLGWEVDAAANGVEKVPECVEAFDRVHEVPWSRNPLDPRNLVGPVRTIRRIVGAGNYDLVHVHTPVASFISRFALRRLRSRRKPRIIYTAHGLHFYRGGPIARNTVFLALEKLAARWTDYMVVMNTEDEQAVARHNIMPNGRYCYMPGIGVDLTRYHPDRVPETAVATFRQELGLAPEDVLYVMVAEFNPGKRHSDAIRAVARLERSNTHLVLAGIGKLSAEMKELAIQLGVSDRVHFIGYRRDIPVLLRAAAALVLPSEREGLPRSIMEALCMEVPVIGSAVRGIVDLVTPETGYVVPVGDIAGLSLAMTRVVDDPAGARARGRVGRVLMQRFSLDKIIVMHEQLYHAALTNQTIERRLD